MLTRLAAVALDPEIGIGPEGMVQNSSYHAESGKQKRSDTIVDTGYNVDSVTSSMTIARMSISLAPGSLSEAVCASEFFQCQILSIALNGNIATRHTRAPYQTRSSSPVMPGSPSKTQQCESDATSDQFPNFRYSPR